MSAKLREDVAALTFLFASATAIYGTIAACNWLGGDHTGDKWIAFWTAAGPVVGWVTLAALVLTAVYARKLIDVTQENARVALTNDSLNADWMLKAAENFRLFMAQDGVNLEASRRRFELLEAAGPSQQLEDLQRAAAAGIYLSRLYLRGVLDKELTKESASPHIVPATYVMQRMFRAWLEFRVIENEVLNLTRDCLALVQSRIDATHVYAELLHWEVPKT